MPEPPANVLPIIEEPHNIDDCLRDLQHQISTVLPQHWQKIIAVVLVYNHIYMSDLDEDIACIVVAESLKMSVDQIKAWLAEFQGDPTEFSQHPVPQPKQRNRKLPTEISSSGTKTWMLEEYPVLLHDARKWVQERIDSGVADGKIRMFKITQFQAYINDTIIKKLREDQADIQDISHSTARNWLSRLGFYEVMQNIKDGKVQTPPKPAVIESLKKPPVQRGRSNTWSGSHPRGSQEEEVYFKW